MHNVIIKKGAFKIAIIYILIGFLWIVLSDRILHFFQGSLGLSTMLFVASIKGVGYVVLTGVMLYKLIIFHDGKLLRHEQQYRSYFEDNPAPMWIYNRDTLQFVNVNNAAMLHYGYSKEEFRRMTILDIRPPEEAARVMAMVRNINGSYNNSGTWVHKKKDGTLIQVQIKSHSISSSNNKNIMVMATDVTDLKEKEATLFRQNDILREIAWVESHEVRRPLASMLSLIDLIKNSTSEEEKKELLHLMDISAHELDKTVCKINHKIDEVTG